MVSLDNMAVLDVYHVDSIIVTHASFISFMWINNRYTPPSLTSLFWSRVDVPILYFAKNEISSFSPTHVRVHAIVLLCRHFHNVPTKVLSPQAKDALSLKNAGNK